LRSKTLAQAEFISAEHFNRAAGPPPGKPGGDCEDTSAAVKCGVEALKLLITRDRGDC